MGKPALSSRSQILVNRLANLFVGLFLMFWGLYYTPPGAVYLYLNITGTIYLAGTFICVIGGLYWKRANTSGWLPGDADGCCGSHHPVLLPALERERHRLLRIWPGRPWTRPRFPDGEARSDVPGRRETLSRALEETQ
jgi:hypothetical protein